MLFAVAPWWHFLPFPTSPSSRLRCETAVLRESPRVPARWQATPDCERPVRWRELVPSLVTVEQFLAANERAEARGRLLAVKFYSQRCRACLRIAAKYRRLALDFSSGVDCYEAEQRSARPLLDALGVTSVPTLQIYRPHGVVMLTSGAYRPEELPRVDKRVRTALRSIRERPGLWLSRGERLEATLREQSSPPSTRPP
ncbi:hypothetical protein EMIHUDRAFT_204762 [Emiliania huxleyi CCMP1516]|uniref:Thioredoxin domain-containing protein n=2 Tax=Emiliania huxleyi TaxID=2903 RepID=A0A0D3JWB0_EMIH1|nr:hypothetical protein EMIHUDRAFT_219475 [Emiliania huxleyi CCMP1516]XP_005780224.1 hypothetical protein EMIHUDRAFT_204762 [Emiliania huxleyi CCMP1516]EOD06142.1 hypothetical protein EMIHUDRAFT_219475 [Emiliania huxleyi CCMP1516]EOD27795.1 hypothetical protein EMIHUDRAFT_204762 [Emiliania huxleyi CCMP1516]|eukprot:XP_005758571.1 hypothetical protein EMIHUDRAFT_219475 [Emiliania huxleyi CCMP1516]